MSPLRLVRIVVKKIGWVFIGLEEKSHLSRSSSFAANSSGIVGKASPALRKVSRAFSISVINDFFQIGTLVRLGGGIGARGMRRSKSLKLSDSFGLQRPMVSSFCVHLGGYSLSIVRLNPLTKTRLTVHQAFNDASVIRSQSPSGSSGGGGIRSVNALSSRRAAAAGSSSISGIKV